ncbi:MAG: hypothetical protein U0U66_04060 [Cytophagaceae bacterium]
MVLRIRVICILLFLFYFSSYAQDISQLGKGKALSYSGNISVQQSWNHIEGIPSRRPPYFWMLQGSLNLSLYGWSVPISGMYANEQFSYQQPFQQYGLSPQYKWLTFHIGYRSLSFSPYTLSGTTFLGGGIELKPGAWNIALLYGRFRKAEQGVDSLFTPMYERWGGGYKCARVGKRTTLEHTLFTAFDDTASLVRKDSTKPQSALNLSLKWIQKFGKYWSTEMEVARVYWVHDARVKQEPGTTSKIIQKLLQTEAPSEIHHAYKTGIYYKRKSYGLGLQWERIDPGYQTLGSYFFQQDIEKWSVAPFLKLDKWKASFQGNIGIQRTNLAKEQGTATQRSYLQLSFQWKWSKRGQGSVSFSNATTYTRTMYRIRTLQQWDSLRYYQINTSWQAQVQYQLGTTESMQSWQNTFNYQEVQQVSPTKTITPFYSATSGYRKTWKEKKITFYGGVQFSASPYFGAYSKAIGPSISLQWQGEKLPITIQCSASYSDVYYKGKSQGYGQNTSLQLGYTFVKKHRLQSMIQQTIKSSTKQSPGFIEWTAQLQYAYSF